MAGIVHPVDGASLLDGARRKVLRQRIGWIRSRTPKPGDVVGHHLGTSALIRITVIKEEEVVAGRRPDEVVLMEPRFEVRRQGGRVGVRDRDRERGRGRYQR